MKVKTIMEVKEDRFDDAINMFIYKHEIIDIKFSTVISATGAVLFSALIMYEGF